MPWDTPEGLRLTAKVAGEFYQKECAVPEKPFNDLSPAQAERLALLVEECGEVQQAVGKILRHGYASYDPTKKNGPNNREALEHEVGDLLAALRLLWARDLSYSKSDARADVKAGKVKNWLHHQG